MSDDADAATVDTATAGDRVRGARGRPIDPDRLAALEEERGFLLRSLADLEREHAAGDVDEVDYLTLKDDYTARAARVIGSIAAGRASLPKRRPRSAQRTALVALTWIAAMAVALFGSIKLVERFTTDRREGDVITGGGPELSEVNALIVDGRTIQPTDPLEAIKKFDAAIAIEPNNVEALTYRGWTMAFVALQMSQDADGWDVLVNSAADFLDRARAADPTYPDAQCFTAIVRFRFQDDAAGAKEPLDNCKAGNPPPEVAGLVAALGTRIDEALAAGATTTSTPTTTTTEIAE